LNSTRGAERFAPRAHNRNNNFAADAQTKRKSSRRISVEQLRMTETDAPSRVLLVAITPLTGAATHLSQRNQFCQRERCGEESNAVEVSQGEELKIPGIFLAGFCDEW
jgi:hypothetical protein